MIRCDPDVTRQGQFKSASQCDSLNGGNYWFRAVQDPIEDLSLSFGGKPASCVDRKRGKLTDVRARNKCFLTRSGNDHSPDPGVTGRIGNRQVQFIQSCLVQCIQFGLAVNGQVQDPVPDLGQKVFVV